MFGIDFDSPSLRLFSFLTVGVLIKLTALGWLRRKRNEKFECVGRVHTLYTYPVKSCGGVEIREADAGLLGLQYKGTLDRHWMVIKGGYMLSSKTASRLILVAVTPAGQGDLRLDAPGMPSLNLNMDDFKQVTTCRHWMVIKGGYMLSSKTASRLILVAVTPAGQGDLRLDAPGMPSLNLNMDDFKQVTTCRHWMVIKGGYMLSSKTASRLILVAVTPAGQGDLRLDAPGMPSLNLNMDDFKQVTTCRIYNKEMDVIDCGEEAAAWLGSFLQLTDVRLVHSPPHLTKRDATDTAVSWKNKTQKGDLTAFNYMTSYMVASASSLHDLNQRLDTPVSMLNFRPNIVIEGTPPYDEDTWVELKIGESLHIRLVDICRRCPLITLDPATGMKSKDKQPLQKLKSYRCMEPYGSSPLFGVYCAMVVGGPVKVGDSVYILREKGKRSLLL